MPKDDVVKIDPKALRIVAIRKSTGKRQEVTDLYWFEEKMVRSFDDHIWDFEITLHDPITP